MQDYTCTVIDEAHCVVHWGKDFRKDFAELEKLRSFMSNSKPFLIASATLPPALLDETLDKLEFQRDRVFMINHGNYRSNITQMMCRMRGGAKDLQAVDWVIDEALQGRELIRTVIYANSRDIVMKLFHHLRQQLSYPYQIQINFIHAFRSVQAKRKVMQNFRAGQLKILVATEVAGMVRLLQHPVALLTIL